MPDARPIQWNTTRTARPTMSAPQDIHYRRLFSCPEMIRDLFDGVIGEPWRPLLDLRHLQPVNPTVPAAEAPRQRHADLVWLVPRTDGQALYVLLQLEHQSTVDGDMALRQAAYCCLLYQDLRRRRQVQRPARLPAVLSLVLYTGETPWRAPAELRELIDPV